MLKYRKYWIDKRYRKYTIHGNMSGICEEDIYAEIKQTRFVIVAILWLLVFKIKYPQVLLTLDNCYIECKDCPFHCKKDI